MKNYELVEQWMASTATEMAYNELLALKCKYTWLKCNNALEALRLISEDMPKIVLILKHQEKQNAIHRRYIELNGLADTAIIEAICKQYKL
jgi:hypothetical protein